MYVYFKGSGTWTLTYSDNTDVDGYHTEEIYKAYEEGIFVLSDSYSKELKYTGQVRTLSLHPCDGVDGVNNEILGISFDLKSWCTFTQADIDKATRAYNNANLPKAKAINKPHGRTLKNEASRQSVLNAAVEVMKAFPELCQSKTGKFQASKIARTIDSKSLLYWSDGEPPLEVETMTRLINNKITELKKTVE